MTPSGHLPGLLGPLATAARALWFLAWSVLAGAIAWAWLFGPTAAPGPAGPPADLVGSVWRRAVRVAWLWLVETTMARLLVTVYAAATGASPSTFTGETSLGWVALFVALALLRPPVRRLTTGPTSTGGSVFALDRSSVAWLAGMVVVGEALTVPTRSKVNEVLRIAIDVTHVASAGVWLGTLALLVVLLRSRASRDAAPAGTPMRAVVRPVAETAARAAAVLVLSGIAAAAISSPGLGRWTSEYSWLLVAKAAVLVVAAAIAWRQWVIVHSRGSVTRAFRATAVEAGALLAAGALAAVLVGVDPLPAASASPAAAPAPAAAAPSTPSCLASTPRTDCDVSTIDSVVAATADGALDATLPELCTPDATRPRAYAYFVCLESVGQAVAGATPAAPAVPLTHCQSFADGWAQQQCAGGVFSKLFTGETASAPSTDAHADDPVWPCGTVAETFKAPCYLQSTMRVLWLNGGDVPAAFTTCDHVEAGWQAECYQSMGRDLTIRSAYEPAAILEACGEAGAHGPGPCIVGAARTLVYTHHPDGAATLCRDAPAADQQACDQQRTTALALL